MIKKKLLHIFLLFTLSLSLVSCQSAYLEKIKNIRQIHLANIYQKMTEANYAPGAPAYIRIFKEENTLELWLKSNKTNRYTLFKSYPVCAYSGLLGPKFSEGDKQSPEGFYDITKDRLWPGSQYHLAMNIGFPNEYDKAHGRYGTNLMIHGDCKSKGCYAMTDDVIEEIYLIAEQALEGGQPAVPVHIFPFRMNNENMKQWAGYEWSPFWRNLKQGYDLFEINKIPPYVSVKHKRYIFPDYYVPRKFKGFVS